MPAAVIRLASFIAISPKVFYLSRACARCIVEAVGVPAFRIDPRYSRLLTQRSVYPGVARFAVLALDNDMARKRCAVTGGLGDEPRAQPSDPHRH